MQFTDAELETLYSIYLAPRTLQSDFSRQWAFEIGVLASQGHITTQVGTDKYGRLWRCTQTGLALLTIHKRL